MGRDNLSEDDYAREWRKKDPYMLDVEGFLRFIAEKEKQPLDFKERMVVINETDLNIDLSDFLSRDRWEVESGSRMVAIKFRRPLIDWTTTIRYLEGKHPFAGKCTPMRKEILVAVNPKNVYPFANEFAFGTKPWVSPRGQPGYEYIIEAVVFHSANDLVRFIYLHEFSHLLDFLQGYRLHRKQTKANRFALRYYRKAS